MFDVNTTINPQLTVSMNDQNLYGYITKGQSTPLPGGPDHHLTPPTGPRSSRSSGKGGKLRAVGSGIATVTATVKYHGVTASTSFTVDVAPLQFTSNPSTVFQVGKAATFTVTDEFVTHRRSERDRSAARGYDLHRQR